MTVATEAPPQNASNGELIRWAFAQLNKRDVTSLRQFWTDATLQRFPDKTCRGPDEIAAYFDVVFTALPDFDMQLVDLIEDGEHVFAHWRLRGTHSGGPFQGIGATGNRIEIDGIDHFVLRDGKVASNFVIYDQVQFARQIGFLPGDGSAADRAAKAAFNAGNRLLRRFR